jgi:RNA polymerase sigma factor FliA
VNLSERNALVVDNLALVGFLVSDLCARADHLSREDLASVGAIALTTAATAYDPERGVPFGAYARRRIVGALSDELRSQDWAPRSARKRIKELSSVEGALTASLGKEPTEAQLAEAMGLSVADVRSIRDDAGRTVIAVDESMYEHVVLDAPSPEEEVLATEERHVVRAAVAALPDQLRYIVEEVYFAGRTVGALAEELGIGHSTVSHARIEAVRLLREGLEAHYSNQETRRPAAPLSARRREYLAEVGDRVAGGATRPDAWPTPAAS